MSTFTSKATGNWGSSGQTTWNEPGLPGIGDSATINSPHNVTVTVDTFVGDGTLAITVALGGILTVADGIVLHRNGEIANAGDIELGVGSEITDFSNTAIAPSAAASLTFSGAIPTLRLTLHPAPASLTFTGATPGTGTVLRPAAGALAFTGKTPSIKTGIRPAAATLTFAAGTTPHLRLTLHPAPAVLMFHGLMPSLVGASFADARRFPPLDADPRGLAPIDASARKLKPLDASPRSMETL